MLSRRHLLLTSLLPALHASSRPLLKPALCAYSYRTELAKKSLSYVDLVNIAVDNAAEGLDLTNYWMPEPTLAFLAPLRRAAFRQSIELYSISMRTDFCKPAGADREANLAFVKKWVDVAFELGAGHIRVFGGAIPKGQNEATVAEWVIEGLKPAAAYAADKGVTLGLENHHGITTNASRILDIIAKVNSPGLGMNLDTGNFSDHGLEQLQQCLDAHVAVNSQVKTEINDAAGQTHPADWDHIFGMFAKSGYRGYLAVEYEGKENSATEVPRLLQKTAALCRKHSATV